MLILVQPNTLIFKLTYIFSHPEDLDEEMEETDESEPGVPPAMPPMPERFRNNGL